MAVKNLKCLVLHGSAVLLVGKAGNPRRGLGTTAKPETPKIGISMPRLSQQGIPEFLPVWRPKHADDCRMDSGAVSGAGRSLRCAGVLNEPEA